MLFFVSVDKIPASQELRLTGTEGKDTIYSGLQKENIQFTGNAGLLGAAAGGEKRA